MTAKTGALPPSQKDEPTKWQCLTCEYVVESASLPYRCPRCGASRVKFVELKGAGAAPEAEE
jgi:rubrerythrin